MRTSRPHISASYLTALESFAASRNIQLRDFIKARDLELLHAGLAEAQVSCAVFVSALEALALAAKNEAFALHFIESLPTRPTGVFHHIVCNSRTLRDAFQAFARFLVLVTDAFEMRYQEQDGIGWLVYDFGDCDDSRTQFVDGQLALIAVRARQLRNADCKPARVDLERAPPTTASAQTEYVRVFGVSPNYNQPLNRIGFTLDALLCPLTASNHNLYVSAHDYAKQLLGLGENDRTLSIAVADFLAGALARGEASETRASAELGVSPRTLQRNLAAEGTTFKAIMEETRARMARHYLVDTDLSLTAIAFLLGYSELSAFSRAAKAWHGASPSQFRKQNKSAPN